MSTPQERLAEYLSQRELTYKEAGKLFKCSGAAVCRYVNAQRWPELPIAFRIAKLTGIPPQLWERPE